MTAADPTAAWSQSPSGTTVRDQDEEGLLKAWEPPHGIGWFSDIAGTSIARRHMSLAFLFFLAGGVMALLMRTQLALPENDFLQAQVYNRLFTMHGTTMMFVFAVPFLEAMGRWLAPMMNGSREAALPRLGTFAFWTYVFGVGLLFSSVAFDAVPDAGWTNYVPLAGPRYSPGSAINFWLVGLTMIELATILTAIELAVTIMRGRAPGMALNRMPIFSWYILVTAFMILFGFPPLIVASILLEVERVFGWPFFDPSRGGEPLLWQHLFWIFGHPEVYIVFLPASGLISTMIASFSRRPTVAHFLFVTAAVGTAFVSFGVWVHHMFTTGIPMISLTLFSGASMTIAVFSGIQVFGWIATMWLGRPVLKTPMLFVLGAILVFTLGGLTGVMVGIVPFDWQAHDTHFVVGHFHIVMAGILIFAVFGAMHYYFPMMTGRMYREGLGKLTFWTMFIGFNLTFIPTFYSGMMGMVRRIAVYPEGSGFYGSNMASTVGSFLLALGIVFFLVNVVISLRGPRAKDDPWESGGLEWAIPQPRPSYTWRSIPEIHEEYPVWEQDGIVEKVRRGEFLLPIAEQNQRLTLTTSGVTAEPLHITIGPKPTYLPLLTSLALLVAFAGFLVGSWTTCWIGTGLFVLLLAAWLWDHPEKHVQRPLQAELDLGLKVGGEGNTTHGWWGMMVGVLSHAAGFVSLLFAFLYVWNTEGVWSPGGVSFVDPELPSWGAAMLAVGSVAMIAGAFFRGNRLVTVPVLLIAALTGAGFVVVEIQVLLETQLQPVEYIYQSTLFMLTGAAAVHAAIAVLGLLYAALWIAFAPHLEMRRNGYRIASIGWHYVSLMGIATVLVVYVMPWLSVQ